MCVVLTLVYSEGNGLHRKRGRNYFNLHSVFFKVVNAHSLTHDTHTGVNGEVISDQSEPQ